MNVTSQIFPDKATYIPKNTVLVNHNCNKLQLGK